VAHLLPHVTEFLVPSSLDEARSLLDTLPETTMILGGGVSLGMIPRKRVTHVLSISALGLDYINIDGDDLRIGAATTLDLLEDTLTSDGRSGLGAITESIKRTATTPLRNRITVGGILAGVGPWADLPVALLTYETTVIIDGARSVTLDSVMEKGPRHVIGNRSILTEIRVKLPSKAFSTFVKVGRNATDLAISSVAVNNRCDEEIIIAAVGGIVPRPVKLFQTSVNDVRQARDDGASPRFMNHINDVVLRRDHRASDEYRIHLTKRLLMDSLEHVLNGGKA